MGSPAVAARFAETIALHEAGVAMMRLNLARRHPDLTDGEIDDLLKAWLADRPHGRTRTARASDLRLTDLAAIIRAVTGIIDRSGFERALVGGLAVSARTEPRFTRDVAVAVAVADDAESERLVRAFVDAGGVVLATIEQDAVGRLAAVRIEVLDGVADLLLASSGIEPEVVAGAERLEVLPDLVVPVASVGHLVALKLLARDDLQRPQDAGDLRALLAVLTPDEQERAAEAVRLIEERGYGRSRDLRTDLAALVEQRG